MTKFAYSSSKLPRITDPAGRVTTFTIVSGTLAKETVTTHLYC